MFFHTNTQYHSISDITAVDWCGDTQEVGQCPSLFNFDPLFQDRINTSLGRFEVVYNLLSLKYDARLRVKVLLDELSPLLSVTSIFRGSD